MFFDLEGLLSIYPRYDSISSLDTGSFGKKDDVEFM
jgi:hypothetical protein